MKSTKLFILLGGGSNAEDCWPLFFLFGSSWKLWKLMSLVTQQFKKMHNVHAVDVFQFYILDFLFHILLMTFSSRVWFISLYMYLILLNTSLLKHSSLLIILIAFIIKYKHFLLTWFITPKFEFKVTWLLLISFIDIVQYVNEFIGVYFQKHASIDYWA